MLQTMVLSVANLQGGFNADICILDVEEVYRIGSLAAVVDFDSSGSEYESEDENVSRSFFCEFENSSTKFLSIELLSEL